METLTDSSRIKKLLQDLHNQRGLLTISIEHCSEKFTSAIISINTNDNHFLLDELKPDTGHQQLTEAGKCRVHGFVNGVSIQFTTDILDSGFENGIRYYTSAIPASLKYLQRRQNVRASISAANPVGATIDPNEGAAVNGELKDISVGGLGLKFQKDLPESFHTGDHITVAFRWPPDPKNIFSCQAEIRLIKHQTDPLQPAFIGCKFLDLTKAEQRRIERLVMTLQRVAQKRRSNL